jgi:hypothetical protein
MKPLVWMRLVRDAGPTVARLAVLLCLALRMRPDGTGYASTRQLADDASVSLDTVKRATKWGRETSHLEQTRRGHRLGSGETVASEWRLTAPAQPVTRAPLNDSQGGTPDTLSDSQGGREQSQGGTGVSPEVFSPEFIPSKTSPVPNGSAPVDADGGREQHRNEPNARRAIAALVHDRTLPFTTEQLLDLAYTVGNGDPWDGYLLRVKTATEQSFTGARDPAAVLRKRLGLA